MRESQSLYGAENETRTRDPHLGKVMLYQLSYFRTFLCSYQQSHRLGVSLTDKTYSTVFRYTCQHFFIFFSFCPMLTDNFI